MNYCLYEYSLDSDGSSSDVEAMDRIEDSNKSKKKHKKHKKHKSHRDEDGKERSRSSKKHKKHKKKKARDASVSNSDSDDGKKIAKECLKAATSTGTVASGIGGIGGSDAPVSTLNKKFTEIMKSNGRVVVATVPTTKILPNNGNGSAVASNAKSSSAKIPTDPNRLVELITQSLDVNIPSHTIVSSESESDEIQDLDSPDVAVIEDDELNLDELMRAKELLQQRLGAYEGSDTDVEEVAQTPSVDKPKSNEKVSAKDEKSTTPTMKRSLTSDVILLDDSSGEALAKHADKKRKKPSPNRERGIRDSRGDVRLERDRDRRPNDQQPNSADRSAKNRRSDNDNRFKEDLRKEIDRDKERSMRENQRRRDGRDNNQDMRDGRERNDRGDWRDKGQFSMQRGQRDFRRPMGRSRSRSRDRMGYRDNRDGRMRSDRDDRYRSGNGADARRRRDEKNDKFVGSLSEGQKAEKDSSSDSDVANLDIADDEDDEEKIIEARRKKREELLKVGFSQFHFVHQKQLLIITNIYVFSSSQKLGASQPTASSMHSSKKPAIKDDDDVIFVDLEKSSKDAKPKEIVSETNTNSRGSTTPPLLSADASPTVQAAPKRTDWDMFAEQDIDSNFDVSHY